MRELLIIAGISAGVVAVAVGAAIVAGAYRCDIQAKSFDDHEYYIIGGCMVKHNGRWLPLGNIRGFGDTG